MALPCGVLLPLTLDFPVPAGHFDLILPGQILFPCQLVVILNHRFPSVSEISTGEHDQPDDGDGIVFL